MASWGSWKWWLWRRCSPGERKEWFGGVVIRVFSINDSANLAKGGAGVVGKRFGEFNGVADGGACLVSVVDAVKSIGKEWTVKHTGRVSFPRAESGPQMASPYHMRGVMVCPVIAERRRSEARALAITKTART